MKQYYKVKQDDKPTGEVYVRCFERTTEQDCTICKAINQFLTDFDAGKYPPEFPKRIRNLGTGNLKAHLKTGKHWKFVRGYYINQKGQNLTF